MESQQLSPYSDQAMHWTIKELGFDTGSRAHPPPTQQVPGSVSQRVKLRGREAHHSPPSSANV
jgi:hypothetical protein